MRTFYITLRPLPTATPISFRGFALFFPLLVGLIAPAIAHATAWYAGEFSAKSTLIDPRNPQNTVQSTFYMGKNRFRTESTYQGKSLVMIVHPLEQKVWTLFPEDKTFFTGPSRIPLPPQPDIERLPADADSPCQQDKAVVCQFVGSETLNGLPAEKWEIVHQGPMPPNPGSNSANPLKRKTLLWVDTARPIILRQQPEGGPSMERLLDGIETLNGRETEKWSFIQSFDGKTRRQTQWIDKKLRLPVKETVEGLTVMELVEIQEKPQPSGLFEIPSEFKEIRHPVVTQEPSRPETAQPPSQPGTLQYR